MKKRKLKRKRAIRQVQVNTQSKETTRQSKIDWLLEFVLLVLLLSFIPDLYIGGVNERFGPCGFGSDICSQTEQWGTLKLALAFFDVCVIIVLLALIMRRKRWEA